MLRKIISGGQTGVDRAALDVALAMNFPCGGSCPRGRLAEDGPIAARYPLDELPSRDYSRRTFQNVVDADGTLIITCMEVSGGTAYTVRCARDRGKPVLIIDPTRVDAPEQVVEWLRTQQVETLNVAGPRASKDAQIHDLSRQLLETVLRMIHPSP